MLPLATFKAKSVEMCTPFLERGGSVQPSKGWNEGGGALLKEGSGEEGSGLAGRNLAHIHLFF